MKSRATRNTSRPIENNRNADRGAGGKFAPGNKAGHRFRPGQSGNPGGRPRGLAANIREKVGEDGEWLINELIRIARGRGGAFGKVQAVRELLTRGFGAAPQFVEIISPDDNGYGFLKHATDEEIDQIEAINLAIMQRAAAAGALKALASK